MTLRVMAAANADVTEALVWLVQKKRLGVVRRLWSFWLAGLDAIEANPRLHPPAEDAPAGREIRNYLIVRYGYRIVYEITPAEIVVLAFARGRRKSRHWHDRLESEN